MSDVAGAAPFSRWERTLALRYLRAKRKEGGVALIALLSFAGITVAVAALIIVMSVMNGFSTILLSQDAGLQRPCLHAPAPPSMGRSGTG